MSCNRESASARERPLVRDVCNRSAVSPGVRLENSSAIDYTRLSSTQTWRTTQRTLAIEEDDRVCLLLDLDLSPVREIGLDGGSEVEACIVGRFTNGNKLPPGLADLERRGQVIFPDTLQACIIRAAKLAVVELFPIAEACENWEAAGSFESLRVDVLLISTNWRMNANFWIGVDLVYYW